MQGWDAALNGVAFVALVIGLAIGWRRSPSVRDTLIELFLPWRKGRESTAEKVAVAEVSIDHFEATWKLYRIHLKKEPFEDSDLDDRQMLRRLRAIRA